MEKNTLVKGTGTKWTDEKGKVQRIIIPKTANIDIKTVEKLLNCKVIIDENICDPTFWEAKCVYLETSNKTLE